MRNMRLFKNNSIAKAFLICLLILSLIGCMAGCNQKTDADAPVRQSEGWAEKSFRNKMADASVTEVVIDDALVLASPVEVAGNKVISGEGSITAIAKNREGDYMIVVPSGVALTVKGSVTIDAAGVMGGVHVQKDASFTLEESAAVKNASVNAANALVEGKLLLSGGTLADAKGHNVYNKNETVISGGTVTGSGEKFAGVYNAGKLTQDDGSICAAYYNVVSVEGSSYTFNKGSVTKSVNNAIVIEKGASLKITSKDASITDAGHRGIYLSGEAVIDQVTMKNGNDTLIKITETGKLTFHDGMLSNAGYHGIDNAGTLLVKGGTINNSYSCGIVNTGSLEMTGGTVMNNANKGILNKLNGVAKVLTEDVYLAGNRFAIGNEDNAYFELTQAAFSGSTNANIYAYGGEMYIHDITLAKSASNNVRVVAAKVTMEDVEILGNAASGSSTTHGILLEGGEVTAKNVTVIGTTGNGIRNKGGKFVGNNIALSSIGNHGVTNTNQDFTGREGVVIIDGLTVDTVRYNNVLAENGTITISNAVLKESGTNNIKVSGGILNLNNVDIQGNIAEAAENVHGIYTTGGTINGKKVTVTNTRGAALRVAGEEAVVSMNGFTAETLSNASVSITEGTVSITDGVMDKTKSNNIRIDGGALTLKNVTINGHHEGAPSNVHALYATGGKVTAEDLTVTASNGAGVRNNGGDVKITGLKVDNVGTHTLYLSNDKSITTITDAALGAAPSNNVNILGGELTLTDSEILGHHKDGARDIHGILTSGGKVNLEDVTISGTTGSGIRNKGAVLNGKNVTIDTFGGYNALSNAASDSGLCGELNIDGLTVTNSVTDKNDLVILASQCDGKVNISNAKFATNTETVTTQANVLVDAGTVVLDNIEMEVVTSNSFRVNGGNVTLKNATIPGHAEGAPDNVNAFYTIGGTTHLENITITDPSGDGLRVNVTTDEEGKVIAEPTVTANNVTVTGAGRHSMWVSGGSMVLEDSTLSGLKSDINNVLVNGGKATLINVVSDKVNKNNNICVNSGELNLQNVQILGHNEGATASNHGLYANGGKLIVDGVSIENTAGSGIRVDNNAVVDAKDVKISVTGQHGIRLGDAGEEASNNLKVTINGLTIENTKTNNILHENGELTVKNAVLHESTSNNIKLIGGKLNLENVQVLGHRDGVRSDNHGIFIEITKNSEATLNAKDILVSNTAGAALRNKGGNVTVNGLIISNIGANTLISNVDHQSVPGVMSISRLGVSEGCDHAQYVVHNQTADTKNPGKFTNELTVKDSIMLLDSKTVGVFAEYGKVTVENSVISGAMYAIHNKAELTVNGGSLHNNGWSVRNEEGAKATLSGGFYYGNKEGTLPSDIYNGGELTIENITVGYNKKGAGRPGVIYQAATADPIIMKGNKMGLHTAAKKLQLAAEEWVRKWGTEKNLIIKCDSVADALEAERFFNPGIEDPKMFVSAVGSNLELTTQPGGNFIIQIGEERFGSFADALKYIAENDSFNTTEGGFKKAATIQIIDSYLHFENVVIPKGYNLTLVDDGKNVHVVAYDSNLTGDMFMVGEGAQLNLKVTGNTNPDSGLIFSGSTDSAKKAAVFCVDGGNIKLLNDLSIEKAYYGIRLVDGEFNAAGKTINTAGTYGIHAIGGELKDAILSGSGTAVCVNDENADATLTNITINGYGTGIYGNAGKLTTNGLTSDAATYNVNVNGTADITVSDATFGKTTSNNAVVNSGKLTLTDVTINGHVDGASGTIHSVMAQGGETTLNNVTITHAKNSGIRIKNNGTIVNMNGGSIANVGNDAINVTDDVVLNSTGNLTISHAAANGVNAAGSAQITIENLTISDVKTRNIIVTGTASVTVESGSFGTTQDAMNIEAKDNSTLNLSNATVTHTSAVEWPHGNTDKINTPVHVMGNSKVTLDNVTLNGGKYGIRVHTSQNVTLNNVTIKDSTQFGMWLQASPKVTVTGELKISGTGSNGIQVNSGTLDASNATKVEITDAGANGLDIRGTANVKNLTVTGAAECGITTIGTVNLTGATTMSNITADGICTNGTNAKVKATGNLTIQNVKRAVFAEKGEIEIAGTKDTITGKYSVSFSNNFKNLVTDGSGKIIAINVKLDKTAETNVEANGKDASIKLENAEVCGTEAYNAVAAQGGDISLNNVTISSSKTAGIRVNNADSSVTVKNVTVSTAGTIGVSMNKGSLTVEDNGEADKASLVITNATTRGIEITGSGVQEIQDDVNISHDEKKSWAMVATTGGKITAADGTKITITGTEYGLVSHNNSIISLDTVAISSVKNNSIYVDGNADTDAARTGVTVKRGTIGTTSSEFNIYVFDGGKLSLSNAAVTSITTATDDKVKDHNGTKVNAVICVRESGTVVDLNGVEVTGGAKGIYISDSAVVNSSGSLKITDSREFALYAYAGGKFIGTDASSLATVINENASDRTDYSIYANGSGTEVTVYNATLGKTQSNNVGSYDGAVVTINGTADKYSVINGNVKSNSTTHGVIVTAGTVNLNYVNIIGANIAGVRTNNNNSVLNCNYVTVSGHSDHGFSLGSGQSAATTLKNITVTGTAGGKYDIYYVDGMLNISEKINADIYFNAAKNMNVVGGLTDGSAVELTWASGKLPADYVAVNFVDANGTKDEAGMNACKTAGYIKLDSSMTNHSLYYASYSEVVDGAPVEKAVALLNPKLVKCESDLEAKITIAKVEGITSLTGDHAIKIGGSFNVGKQIDLAAFDAVEIVDDGDSNTGSEIAYNGSTSGGLFLLKENARLTLTGISIDSGSKVNLLVPAGNVINVENVTIKNAYNRGAQVQGTLNVSGNFTVESVTAGDDRYAITVEGTGILNGTTGSVITIDNAKHGLYVYQSGCVDIDTLKTGNGSIANSALYANGSNVVSVDYAEITAKGDAVYASGTVNMTIETLNVSNSNKNINAAGNAHVTVNGGTLGKSTSNNVTSGGAGSVVTLKNVSVNGATNASTHGVLAQDGDVVLENVTITSATGTDGAGIRVNRAGSTVTVTGKLEIKDVVYAISISAGEVDITGAKDNGGANSVEFSAKKRNILMDGGTVKVTNATLNATSEHNVHPRNDAATVTLTDCEILGGGQYGVLAEHGHAVLNRVSFSGCKDAIRSNQATSTVVATDVTINNSTRYGISISNGEITINGATVTNSANHDIYVENANGTMNIGGKVKAEVYFNVADVLNVTAALTDSITVDWATAPAGAVVTFASEDVMNASKDYIALGSTQTTAGNLLYFHMDGSNAVATLVNKVVTSEAELNDYLAAAVQHGMTEAEIIVAADIELTKTVAIPAGMSVTITDDGTARTVSRNASYTGIMFDVGEGETLILRSTGTKDAPKLTISGAQVADAKHMLYAKKSTVKVLSGVKLTDNYSNTKNSGAAIYAGEATNVTIDGATFSNNKATYGGAIRFDSAGNLDIDNALFENNVSTLGFGGAISVNGVATITIDATTFKGNKAENVSGAQGGGALMFQGSPKSITINGCSFVQNTATSLSGGAIKHNSMTGNAKLVINDCTFTGNSANNGGAIYNQCNAGFQISNSTFTSNTATAWGGAYANWGGETTISGCKFDQNSAVRSGGAVFNYKGGAAGVMTLSDCSFTGNTANTEGGGAVGQWAGTSVMIIENCTFGELDASNNPVNGNTATNNGGAIYVQDDSALTMNGNMFYGNSAASGADVYIKDGKDIKLSGKTNPYIYFAAADVLNVTGNLTDDVTVDWASGKAPAGAVITFASEDVMNASKDLITLGKTQSDADNLLKFEGMEGKLVPFTTVTGWDALSTQVNALTSGDKTFYKVTGNASDWVASTTLVIPEGVNVTLFGDDTAPAIVAGAGISPFTLNANSVLTLDNLTVGGTQSAKAAGIDVVNGAKLYLVDTTLQYMTADRGGAVLVWYGGELNAVGSTFYKNTATAYAGAVGNWGGATVLTDCVFDSNQAPSGGAILNYRDDAYAGDTNKVGTFTCEACVFVSNKATANGGAIGLYASGSSTITDCVFGDANDSTKANTAATNGGAIYIQDSHKPTITDSRFYSNSAKYGGAIYAKGDAVLTVITSSFYNNASTNRGGAIYSNAVFTVEECLFEGNKNTGDYGGAIYSGNTMTVTESTFNENSTTSNGGAIEMNAGKTMSVSKCTFYKNSAKEGGALMMQSGPTVTIDECTFTANTATTNGGAIKNNSGKVTITNTTFGSANDATLANKAASGGAVAHQGSTLAMTDCKFLGNTATTGGGALYIFNNVTATATTCEFIGNSAPKGGAVYLGLDAETDQAGTLTANDCTFSDNSATNGTGGAVYGFKGALTADGCSFTENSATGLGGAISTESGAVLNINNTVGACVFSENSGTEGGAISTIGKITATGAKFEMNESTTGRGGAVIVWNAVTATFTNCEFSKNTAATFGGAISKGGGSGGTLNIDSCTFEKNKAYGTTDSNGGGALMIQSSPTVTVNNSTFTGNFAAGNGGAIKNNSSTNAIQIIGSIFTENTANNKGGAIYDQAGKTYTITGCTFTDNTAANGGNAIFNAGSTTSANLSGGCTFNGAANPAAGQISGNYAIAQ